MKVQMARRIRFDDGGFYLPSRRDWFKRFWREIDGTYTFWALAVALGVTGLILWVGLIAWGA